MAHDAAVWHGSQAEKADLLAAMEHHCGCVKEPDGRVMSVCEPHRMLTDQQRQLDGLVMVRRLRHRLLNEEFSAPPAFGGEEITL